MCSMLNSCEKEPKKEKFTAYSMDYFDTVITVVGYEKTKEEFDIVVNEIMSLFSEYHKLYTIYNRYDGTENLCTINETVNGAHTEKTVDKRIVEMLLFAKQMYDETSGMMNVAMGSVLSIWHSYREIGNRSPDEASLPPIESLKKAAENTDIVNLIIDAEKNTVFLSDPLMKLDVGAVAKGYATEQIAAYLEKKGVTGYILNVGGNVRAIGTKPDGEAWTVGIENPLGEEYLAYLYLNGMSVVTSGSYQRFYYVDGNKYHHIIHPETQMPASNGYASVSVICKGSDLGDALSTALFCMSIDDGKELLAKYENVEAMWLMEDGTMITTSGWSKYLKK